MTDEFFIMIECHTYTGWMIVHCLGQMAVRLTVSVDLGQHLE